MWTVSSREIALLEGASVSCVGDGGGGGGGGDPWCGSVLGGVVSLVRLTFPLLRRGKMHPPTKREKASGTRVEVVQISLGGGGADQSGWRW